MAFRQLWLVVASAALVGACTPEAPRLSSKELRIYGFAEYLPPELLTGFEKSAGVKVSYDTYVSNEAMAAGLLSAPAKYDVILPSDYMVESLIDERRLLPIDLAQVPEYNNVDQRFQSPYFDPMPGQSRRPGATQQSKHKFSLPFQWGTVGIAYDATKVNPAPARWADLWRPDLAGHLVVLDDAREMLGLTLLSLGHSKNATDPAQINAARDQLKALSPGVLKFDSDSPEKLLASGEAWAGVVYNGNAALAARQNPNIAWVFPEEGAGIWFDNMAIPAQAPHPDAALAFMAYVLRPENSALITRAYPYSNPNRAALEWLEKNDATLYTAYIQSPLTNPSPDALAGAQLVKRLRPEIAALYEQAWTEAKAGR